MLRRLCLILVACLLFAGPVAARGRISEAGIGDAKTPGDLSTWQARPCGWARNSAVWRSAAD